jgi:hypothetical protein
MAQALTWLATLLVIGFVFWMLVRDNDRRRRRTAQEWENELAAGQGKTNQFVRAGALGLDAMLFDRKRQAIEYKQDEDKGMTKTGGKSDDADRTAKE